MEQTRYNSLIWNRVDDATIEAKLRVDTTDDGRLVRVEPPIRLTCGYNKGSSYTLNIGDAQLGDWDNGRWYEKLLNFGQEMFGR